MLAKERQAILLIDEHEARKEAQAAGIPFTGTIGCLIKAKQRGYITSVKTLLDDMRRTTLFRISAELYRDILKEVQEK